MSIGKIHAGRYLAFLCSLLIFLFTACEETACNACEQGTCIEEQCNCDAYYEGEDCSELTTDKFLGDWQKGDICNSGSEAGNSRVEATSTIGRIQFSLIGPENQALFAVVNGEELEIPEQTYGAASISGIGAIDNDGTTITLDYQVEYQGSAIDNCFSTLTR